MQRRPLVALASFVTAQLLLANGCTRWEIDRAPAGFAIVREHIVLSPHNDPPVATDWDFTLLAVDDAAITRETIPPWVDLQRGALIAAGSHRFMALAQPHRRTPHVSPKEVVFTAIVESGKVYFLVGTESAPQLVAQHLHSR